MDGLGRAAFPGNPRACMLPKSSPYVGHYRHAPPSPVHAELAERLQNLLSRSRKTQDTNGMRPLSLLPRDSPFVGTKRHAPQSPKMSNVLGPRCTSPLACTAGSMSPTVTLSPICLGPAALPTERALAANDGPLGLFFLDDNLPDLDDDEEEEECFCLRPLFAELYQEEEFSSFQPFPSLTRCIKSKKSLVSIDSCLPHTTLCQVLKSAMTTKLLGSVLSVNHAFADAAKSPLTWQGIPVSLPPSAPLYEEEITNLLGAWTQAKKIVMPRCSDLFAEVLDVCPDVPTEIAWRFDPSLKGSGVQVRDHGKTACKINEDKVVVLGDAPVRNSYFEIVLDERDDDTDWDNPNDFGLGVTSSRTKAGEHMKKVEVAGEVPHSWVVDFSKRSIFLVINNEHAAQYDMFGAEDISKGDRVGLFLEPNAIYVYVNGIQEACLQVPEHAKIDGILYPVFDLYGRTKRMTRSVASHPLQGRD